jgi:hypothetical protein
VIENDAAAQRQGERHCMIGDLGRAVIRHVAEEDVARRRRSPVDPIVADPHPHDRAQPRKPRYVLGRDCMAHDHQTVDGGAVRRVELCQPLLGAPDEPHLGTEDLPFQLQVGNLPVFRIKHGDGHRRLHADYFFAASMSLTPRNARW